VKLAWSRRAVAELNEIRRFSIERWGREIALQYLQGIQTAAKHLSIDALHSTPLKGQSRILRVRSRCLIAHVDITADLLTIARVIHVSTDIDRHLP
jgi:plasmid stabilization system protein ParE